MNGKSYPDFLGSEITAAEPAAARFHVIPVPLERSVSYGAGTACGPLAVLNASQQLELFDGKGVPAEAGIYTHQPVDCTGDIETVLDRIEGVVEQAVDHGAIPMVLGGEHTVSLGAVRAVRTEHRRLGIVQFDAHADLRHTYQGDRYSHACVMRRILELDVELFQIGVRSLSRAEAELRQQRKIGRLDAAVLAERGLPPTILPPDFPEAVYLSIDVDGFDPSVIPATGTPEPGGPGWYQALSLFTALARERRLAGVDLVELAPVTGFNHPEYTAARLLYFLMGVINSCSPRR